jgi:hypothetical protein
MAEFVDYVRSRGLPLRAVPSSVPVHLEANTLYLTESPDETTWSFNLKAVDVSHLDRWKASVWVTKVSPFYSVNQDGWGRNGFRVGDFVLFGDERLIRSIQQLFPAWGEGWEDEE